jgi:hypothetical protein
MKEEEKNEEEGETWKRIRRRKGRSRGKKIWGMR